jgi:hypothetical protein
MSSPMLVPRDALQIDIQSLDGLDASGKTFVKPASFSFTRPLHSIVLERMTPWMQIGRYTVGHAAIR